MKLFEVYYRMTGIEHMFKYLAVGENPELTLLQERKRLKDNTCTTIHCVMEVKEVGNHEIILKEKEVPIDEQLVNVTYLLNNGESVTFSLSRKGIEKHLEDVLRDIYENKLEMCERKVVNVKTDFGEWLI